MTLIETMAIEIVTQAVDQGATAEMIASWDLLPGDREYIREQQREAMYASDVHPSQVPQNDKEEEALLAVTDWRLLFAEVERAVRSLSYMAE